MLDSSYSLLRSRLLKKNFPVHTLQSFWVSQSRDYVDSPVSENGSSRSSRQRPQSIPRASYSAKMGTRDSQRLSTPRGVTPWSMPGVILSWLSKFCHSFSGIGCRSAFFSATWSTGRCVRSSKFGQELLRVIDTCCQPKVGPDSPDEQVRRMCLL